MAITYLITGGATTSCSITLHLLVTNSCRSSGLPVTSFPELLARGRAQRGSLQRAGKRTSFGSGWAMSVQEMPWSAPPVVDAGGYWAGFGRGEPGDH